MRRRKLAEQNSKPPLAVASDEERTEYARRMRLFDSAHVAALAAGSYLDQMGEELRVKYDLPPAYNFDLDTGAITAREEG